MKTQLNTLVSLALAFSMGLAACVTGDEEPEPIEDIETQSHELGLPGGTLGPNNQSRELVCRGYSLCCQKGDNAHDPNNQTCYKQRCGTMQGQDLLDAFCISPCEADEYMVESAFVDGVWTQRVPCETSRIDASQI